MLQQSIQAKKLGGDYSTFIDLMNKEAKELGCTDTHFNNAKWSAR